MKPTVGRIIHTRRYGVLVPAIITRIDGDPHDTKDDLVQIAEVEMFGAAAGPERICVHVMLGETENDVPQGEFFWPERQP